MTTSSPWSSTSYEPLTASQFTQTTMWSDLLAQRGLLIGAAVGLVGLVWWLRRSSASDEEEAARRLVRDWRHVDDADDARDLVGSNLPVIFRPALLAILEVVQDQVHQGFRQLERQVERL
jgi:hypothetical protein